MKRRRIWQIGLGLVSVTGWTSSAWAFDIVFTAAVERSVANSRVEVFAALILPLDEWAQVTPEVVRRINSDAPYARAWEWAENSEELAAAQDGADVHWLVDPPWLEPPVSEQRPAELSQPSLPDAAPRGSEPSRLPGEPRGSGPGSSSAKIKPPKLDQRFLKALVTACSGEFRNVRGELDDLADRARLSAWLPEIQVKGGRNSDQTLRLSPTEAEPDRYQVVGGDGVRFEGQVRWTFSQLVFARDELAVARLRGALDVEQRKRQQQAIETLCKWLAAWMVLVSRAAPDGDLLTAWVTESALRAELDWLSDGWFSAHVPAAPEWTDVTSE